MLLGSTPINLLRIALDLNPLGEHPRTHAAQGGKT
jgi:hypothetical protein